VSSNLDMPALACIQRELFVLRVGQQAVTAETFDEVLGGVELAVTRCSESISWIKAPRPRGVSG